MSARRPRRRLGVIGWPVAHSRSPAMHNAALAALGMTDWRYQLLPVPAELVEETLRALGGAGFAGVNVTIPHKHAALAVADAASARARAIGAANTLLIADDGELRADNTDAPALLDTLGALAAPRHGVRSALVLGAGGSARAALWALREAGTEDLRIWNRTPERAAPLAARFGARVVDGEEAARGAQVLVNCTAVELHGEDPFAQLPLTPASIAGCEAVADYAYRTGGTRLIAAARAAGVPTVDGLELLVVQGALAFARFTGRPAPLELMRAAARSAG